MPDTLHSRLRDWFASSPARRRHARTKLGGSRFGAFERSRKSLAIEPLEDRRLLAVAPTLVRDINVEPACPGSPETGISTVGR